MLPIILKVLATAYCACCICTGPYWCRFKKTFSGATPKQGITVACDPKLLPIGTKIRVGEVTLECQDIGEAIKGHRIDIYFHSHQEALEWGRRKVLVEVISPPDRHWPGGWE